MMVQRAVHSIRHCARAPAGRRRRRRRLCRRRRMLFILFIVRTIEINDVYSAKNRVNKYRPSSALYAQTCIMYVRVKHGKNDFLSL